MDLMENSNKWTNDKKKLRNCAPSLCRSKIPQKKKKKKIKEYGSKKKNGRK